MFLETRIDDRIAYEFRSDPEYSTRIVPMENGKEFRNINWDQPKRQYGASYKNFSIDLYKLIIDTYHAAYGSGYGFRFKDFFDFEVIDGDQGTVPVGFAPLQLIKKYTFGASTQIRIITKPVAGTLTVYENGVVKAGTIDTATGLFTPDVAWAVGAVITATFEFDVPVRFLNDSLPSTYSDFRIVQIELSLVEIDPFD